MRRTISTLMFLAVGGLAFALQAAEPGQASGNWNYYSAGQSRYRISDDDDGSTASNATEETSVTTAVGQPPTASQEKNAVYLTNNAKSAGELLQTNYFAGGDGCQAACGCENNSCGNNGCGNTCLSDCCDCDCSINSFRFEWLGWFSRGRNTPPLVTTSPSGTPRNEAGVLGLASTTILYGDDPIGINLRNGGRMTFSHLFNDSLTTGTVRFWGIEDGSATFATNSNNRDIIGLPFVNFLPNAAPLNDSFLISYPGISGPGSIAVRSKNDLIGADAWLSRNWYCDGCTSIDVLGGYQFARMDDSIVIDGTTVAVANGNTLNVFDSFRTQNEFHGASAGVIARSYRGPITLEGLFKVAMGNMRETVIINGNTTITPAGGGTPTTTPGGIYTQPTNIGRAESNRFAFVPEVNLNLIYNVNCNWRVIGGYSFIYWSTAVLAGNQIDTNINTTQFIAQPLQGPAFPAAKFQRSDFWVQGVNLGAEYRW